MEENCENCENFLIFLLVFSFRSSISKKEQKKYTQKILLTIRTFCEFSMRVNLAIFPEKFSLFFFLLFLFNSNPPKTTDLLLLQQHFFFPLTLSLPYNIHTRGKKDCTSEHKRRERYKREGGILLNG